MGGYYAYHVNLAAGETKAPGIMGGFVQRIQSLQVNFQTEYNIDAKQATLNVGIINWF